MGSLIFVNSFSPSERSMWLTRRILFRKFLCHASFRHFKAHEARAHPSYPRSLVAYLASRQPPATPHRPPLTRTHSRIPRTTTFGLRNKRFFGNLHVMAAQLLPAQLLELQRRPQAARRLGLTQAAPKGSIIVPKGELNPRARVTPHLSARQPTPHEILRGRQFFPAASAGARCSHGASLHSRPKPRIRR